MKRKCNISSVDSTTVILRNHTKSPVRVSRSSILVVTVNCSIFVRVWLVSASWHRRGEGQRTWSILSGSSRFAG